MKKTLLLAAAAVATLTSQAAFSDVAKVSIEGVAVEDGATINVDTHHDEEWWVDPDTGDKEYMGGGYTYVAEIDIENLKGAEVPTTITVDYTDHPSQAMAEAAPDVWGTLQICQKGAMCFPGLTVDTTIPADGAITWQFDNKVPCAYPDIADEDGNAPDHNPMDKAEPNRKYKVTLTVDSQTLSFFVNFQYVNDTRVGDVIAADGAAEYFDLQGRRVANPANGLYIVKKNGKTSKMVIR